MGQRTFADGTETRTISWEALPDGTAHVTQLSGGDLTVAAYGAQAHITEIAFRPTSAYGLEDIKNDIVTRDDDVFLMDISDALDLWGISYELTTVDHCKEH